MVSVGIFALFLVDRSPLSIYAKLLQYFGLRISTIIIIIIIDLFKVGFLFEIAKITAN